MCFPLKHLFVFHFTKAQGIFFARSPFASVASVVSIVTNLRGETRIRTI